MARFYFTYGGNEVFPFQGGWSEVEAEDRHKACAAFRAYHPDITEGILNCSDVYTQEEFIETGMAEDNLGACCHEFISLMRETSIFRMLRSHLLAECQLVNVYANNGDLTLNNVKYGGVSALAKTMTEMGYEANVAFYFDSELARVSYVVIDGQKIDIKGGDE